MDSPLKEVSPESLQELFNKNPKELTDQEIEKIVSVLQAQRAQFNELDSKPKKKQAAKSDLSLEDLEI